MFKYAVVAGAVLMGAQPMVERVESQMSQVEGMTARLVAFAERPLHERHARIDVPSIRPPSAAATLEDLRGALGV